MPICVGDVCAGDSRCTDVPDRAWYHDGLDWATAQGIVTGYADDTFRPRRPVNRGQVAGWLWAFAGRPTGAPDHPFPDVRPGAWFADGLEPLAGQVLTGEDQKRLKHLGQNGDTIDPNAWGTWTSSVPNYQAKAEDVLNGMKGVKTEAAPRGDLVGR